MVEHYLDNCQKSYKPQAKHAGRMIYCLAVHKNDEIQIFQQSVSQLLCTQRYVCIFLSSSFSYKTLD